MKFKVTIDGNLHIFSMEILCDFALIEELKWHADNFVKFRSDATFRDPFLSLISISVSSISVRVSCLPCWYSWHRHGRKKRTPHRHASRIYCLDARSVAVHWEKVHTRHRRRPHLPMKNFLKTMTRMAKRRSTNMVNTEIKMEPSQSTCDLFEGPVRKI